jgi:adenylylsulfate kinase
MTGMPKQKGFTLWFTGLSGSGKTTIAREVERRLKAEGCKVECLDGDEIREYLCRDLGFSKEDRDENIRRVSYVAGLLTRNDIITLCCFISPYREARQEARELIGDFIEVYVNAPLEVCETRDVKGLYRKARAGLISNFTGVSDSYEPPENPELEIDSTKDLSYSVEQVLDYLKEYMHQP